MENPSRVLIEIFGRKSFGKNLYCAFINSVGITISDSKTRTQIKIFNFPIESILKQLYRLSTSRKKSLF